MLNQILDYIYPARCPACEAISQRGFCVSCQKQLIYIRDQFCLKCGKPIEDPQQEYCGDCLRKPHEFYQGRSLFSYQGVIRQSLYRFKYMNKRTYARVYGEELARNLGGWIRACHITRIVPIPLHPSRKRVRGYNQAALIARELGRNLGIPVDEQLLYRTRKTSPQKMLTDRERRENLKHAFYVDDDVIPGENILLVDDIYTTGSTVDAAARCIRRRGDCKIYVVTVSIGG